jgi:multicomponent K+:H+ antiporter subunit D
MLVSGLAAALVLARAASAFFWEPGRRAPDAEPAHRGASLGFGPVLAVGVLVAASPLLTLAAAPVAAYGRAAAQQLQAGETYIAAVLGERPHIERERRP